ncbi:hypothetical protein [Asticcacaulis sp. AND118]|uniref:hypothetical protein n=1 Tax=Asticcacaulis sp. AND118 TaxID=2840468 RepID=UPI001CFFF56B|nr:hypothetical protein [Asticcacaulis sp. AND118]UDF02314.1 hypothetical protein LH365_07600 [Asticcacaulis sp. AND118]
MLTLSIISTLTGCTPLRGPLTGPEWVVWGCGVAGFVVFLLGVPGVVKGGFLRLLLHVLITAMLVTAAGWMVMQAPKAVEARAVICGLGLGLLIVWTIWAASGFDVGKPPPDPDDDNFLKL